MSPREEGSESEAQGEIGKASATAPANIAFIKYWGALDLNRALPENPSISMTLTSCLTHTTVEYTRGEAEEDEVFLVSPNGELSPAPSPFAGPVLRHLNEIRQALGERAGLGVEEGTEGGGHFRVATRNTFPSAAGMASSASGFSALAVAAVRALGLELSIEELSRLARRSGSGSAARSVMGGYVEWPRGNGENESHAFTLAEAEHWDLRDVVAVVETAPKEVSSREGHRRARTSPYYPRRQELLAGRLEAVRRAIADRDFDHLGPVIEEEAVDLHLIAMSSDPPIFYWGPATVAVLAELRRLRRQGLAAWATMDAGANVHVICQPHDEAALAAHLQALPGVVGVIRDRVGHGPETDVPHLF